MPEERSCMSKEHGFMLERQSDKAKCGYMVEEHGYIVHALC